MKLIPLVLTVASLTLPVCPALDAQTPPPASLTPAALEARIAAVRMGDITVKAPPGTPVKIRQTRHEFKFGAAITNALAENDTGAMSAATRKKFLEILGDNFNFAVHENALKWYDCERVMNVVDYRVADRIWELCRERNIPMRGHCIFWEKDKYVMSWLKPLDNDRLRAAVHRRAIGVTEHFRGRINEFDLNNEMINGDFFRRRLGYGIINEMAYMARAGNPDAVLYVNDYGILCDGGFNASTYVMQIQNLLANGVPIGGIGVQGHPSTAVVMPMSVEHVQKTLDTLAKFGLPIKITECLFIAPTEQAKADELRKIFPLYFAHPAIEAVLMWGFWEGDMWKPEAAMWKTDWTPNPIALAYRDLVFHTWWTTVDGKTGGDGTFRARGYYGDYVVSAGEKTKAVTLRKKDASVEVKFE